VSGTETGCILHREENTVLAEVGMPTPRSAITLGMIAPDFTLPAVDGRMISLSSYRGTVHVILAFLRGAR